MNKNKSLILGILVFFSSTGAQALSETGAYVAGTAVSAAIALVAPVKVYKKAILFTIMELLSVKLFLQYTPENRYLWAVKNLEISNLDVLFMANIEQSSLSAVLQDAGCESFELPLVNAFLRLQHYDKQLVYMQEELQKALSDVEQTSSLAQKIIDLIEKIKPHLRRVRSNEAFIKNQKDWLEQWKIYQERLLAKEKLDHYDRMQTHIVWNIRNF